jgi:hypothetical protein
LIASSSTAAGEEEEEEDDTSRAYGVGHTDDPEVAGTRAHMDEGETTVA